MPHPFAPYPQNAEEFLMNYNKKLLKKIDGFEVLNGLMKKDRNMKSLELTKKLDKSYIGGSDGHTLFQLGRVVTVTENSNAEEFLDNIKAKKNIVMGEEVSWGYRKLIHLIIFKNSLKIRVKTGRWQ